MRISLKWMKDLVDIELPVKALADRLDMTGTAVDGIETVGEGLSGFVIGKVLTREAHPEADKLSLSDVDVGGSEPLHIVCGAPNYSVGDKVAVALVGTTLPNGLTLKRAKIRGQLSEGMMCAADELGLGTDHTGLIILPEDAPVGMAFAEYRGMSDTVLDLEITPNRPDCLSMVGMAREIGAVTDTDTRPVTFEVPESGGPAADVVSVEIADPSLCLRYTARVIRGVKIGPSPDWLVERVVACGARPINNVVDITNYVMFELGQPLHAFDLATIGVAGGKASITVRVAGAGETLVTLDGQERQLADDTLLICDPSGPVALAGVMGGENTEVSDTTVDILLESACFAPASTSRTSRRLGLISEASQRFERGVDPNGCVEACDRAAALLAELAGGVVAPGIVDAYPQAVGPRDLELRVDRLDSLLGMALSPADVERILTRLGMSVRDRGDRVLAVSVPTFRPDIEREVDLIEEVVRVYGMDRVTSTLPAGRGRIGGPTGEQRTRDRVGATLRATGLNEAITFSFADPRDLERTRWTLDDGVRPVALLNPMTEDQSVMRWSTLPGMLRAVANNQRKGVPDVHLYEIGSTWTTAEGRKQPWEREVVAGVLAGRWERPAWHEAGEAREDALGFFDGKGVLESLVEDLGVAKWKLRASERPWLQPGRSADALIGGEVAGWIGEVHPSVADAFEATSPVTVFEISLAALLRATRDVREFVDVPRFPAVKADLAIVVDDSVAAERVADAMRSAGGRLLESVRLFDVYRGPGVAEGRKSLAFSLTYRDPERTLTDAEVDAAHEKLVRKATRAVDGELRG